jgi:hypothetical protein
MFELANKGFLTSRYEDSIKMPIVDSRPVRNDTWEIGGSEARSVGKYL